MVEVIFKHGGTLDKYIGDAIMAVFGAPFGSERDADNAVSCALDMQRALTAFNQGREAAGLPELAVRIGINTDEAIAGNIGSTRRMDYTVIGDGVNLTARLESANRYFGTYILLSGSTVNVLRSHYGLREIDSVRVKGKLAPVPIFELLGDETNALPPGTAGAIAHYAAALRAYRMRDWNTALARLEDALVAAPLDQPSQLLRARVLDFRESPPPAQWDGVWVLADK
ncbi:MAG: adenylate/guanylate cyclase domain-containing protein [Gammaproteobacteria bacterium]|nr:adenylate/guanylate cyclase domain-containing protein [Gammaproteobacteria bacterium]